MADPFKRTVDGLTIGQLKKRLGLEDQLIQPFQITPGSYPDNSVTSPKIAVHAARLTGTIAAVATGVVTNLVWTAETYDTTGFASTSTGITIPRTGIWRFDLYVQWAAPAVPAGIRVIYLTAGGVAFIEDGRMAVGGGAFTTGQHLTEESVYAEGQVISGQVIHTQGANLGLSVARLSAHWVSAS